MTKPLVTKKEAVVSINDLTNREINWDGNPQELYDMFESAFSLAKLMFFQWQGALDDEQQTQKG